MRALEYVPAGGRDGHLGGVGELEPDGTVPVVVVPVDDLLADVLGEVVSSRAVSDDTDFVPLGPVRAAVAGRTVR